MAERWTQERRRQHTRDVLLDAAAEVFAARGFEGASLDEIAETAGYTRGAIYKHFGDKAEMFMAVNERLNERMLEAFRDIADPAVPPSEVDLAAVAKTWRSTLSPDPRTQALGAEFNLYLLRNPEARARVAGQRRHVAETIAGFIDEMAARTGFRTRIPSLTIARIVLASTSGIEISAVLDGEDDLYEPFLSLLVTAWEPGP